MKPTRPPEAQRKRPTSRVPAAPTRPPTRPPAPTRPPTGAPAPARPPTAPPTPGRPPRTVQPPAQRSATHLQRDEEALQSDAARGRVWTLIADLHTLMKAVVLHDAGHPVAKQSADTLCKAIEAMSPPFVLQFVAGGVFLDRTLVPLDFNHFERCQALTRALARLGAHELSFESSLAQENALQLGHALAAATRGQRGALEAAEIPGLTWREIPHAQSGIDAEGVDPDVAAIAHTLLGLGVVEQIAAQPDEPWPWNMGLAVIRRIEKGLAANAGAAMRVIEFAPEGWPIARRALSASQLVLQVLTRVGADPPNRRAAAHAALALALQGLRPRDGLDAAAAADGLATRMTRAPIQAESGIAPQCLLVASLAHLMGSKARHGSAVVSLIVTELIELAYEMERARCPARVPFDLGRADVLAFALQHQLAPDWMRAVIKICGAVPVGACVQLRDGRVGIVIEPGPPEQPWCPVVFVAGERVAAHEPVMLVPPTQLRRVDQGFA